MPKKVRQKKFVSDEYLQHIQHLSEKYNQGGVEDLSGLPARVELSTRHSIDEFLQLENRQKQLLVESHGVELLFTKEPDDYELMKKRRVVLLYVGVHGGMSKSDYVANWPIVREYLRRIKEVQGICHDDEEMRFCEMLEFARRDSNGKMGYGKLAELVNKWIEGQLRAEKQNESIRNKVIKELVELKGRKHLEEYYKNPEKLYEELIRKGYNMEVENRPQSEDLFRYFKVKKDQIDLIKTDPMYFAFGEHSYALPVTAADVRIKLSKYRRLIAK